MKTRVVSLGIVLIFATACTVSTSSNTDFEKQVATKAAFALTATAITSSQESQNQPTEPVIPTSAIATPTPTPDITIGSLGDPTWKDDFSNPVNWFKSGSSAQYGNSIFKIQNGSFTFETSVMEGMIWHLSYKQLQNFYIEADFETIRCAGNDQFGLVIRATNYVDGYAYYPVFTCDGKFNILKNTNSGLTALAADWKAISDFSSPTDGKLQMGVWVKDNTIRLYANRVLLQEFTDSSLPGQGHIGFFINPRQTSAFQVQADRIAYWVLN